MPFQAPTMANFGGHAIPGAFFLLFGLWLTVKNVLNHQWRSNKAKGQPAAPPFIRRMNYGEGGLTVFASFVGELSPLGSQARLSPVR